MEWSKTKNNFKVTTKKEKRKAYENGVSKTIGKYSDTKEE